MSKSRKKKRKHPNRTPLSGHQKVGSKLLPPLAQMPWMQHCSWMEQRLPEMLWAVLLAGTLDRPVALDCFRSVAGQIFELPDDQKYHDVTLTGLSEIPEEAFAGFCQAVVRHQGAPRVLSSMLLYSGLPGRERWKQFLPTPSADDIPLLMQSVGKCLWHQSQEATDCRWVRLLCTIVAGRMHMPREIGEPIVNYPDQGDQRKIRPSIRASEIQLDAMGERKYEWSGVFWKESLDNTPCLALPTQLPSDLPQAQVTTQAVAQVYARVAGHFLDTEESCKVDAKHDQVFGAALYALSVLQELLTIGAGNAILGRLGLRTIVECHLTLAYLVKENDPKKWASFRVYGSGQAKLSSLKIDEGSSSPTYLAQEDLDSIASEDVWHEFLSIETGHWDKSNLRAMSIQGNLKETYDSYYLWPSVFAHGHWAALRDTVFQTCGNPLHMLHRIPRDQARFLRDVVDDAVDICESILCLVEQEYPGLSISLKEHETESNKTSGGDG